MQDWIGKIIFNYEVIDVIGHGGMGIVLKGRHIHLKNRIVAIKVLAPTLVNNQEIRERFKNEAETLAMLSHKNIVRLYDYYEDEKGQAFLIMEYVEGVSLYDIIHKQKGPLSEEEIKQYFSQILDGFHYAHENGIIHRDVKPSNIIITPEGNAKILDFGIAKVLGSNLELTKTGARVGTILYMSPEQVLAKPIDRRSDIYSLGVVLFEAATGEFPFPTKNVTEFQIYEAIIKNKIPNPLDIKPDIPQYIVNAIKKATAKDPDDRFQDCMEFKNALMNPSIEDTTPPPVGIDTKIIADSLDEVLGDVLKTEKKEPEEVIPTFEKTAVIKSGKDRQANTKKTVAKAKQDNQEQGKPNKKIISSAAIAGVFILIIGGLIFFRCPLFNVAGKSEDDIKEYIKNFYAAYDVGNYKALEKFLGDGHYYSDKILSEEEIIDGIKKYKNSAKEEKHYINSINVYKLPETCSADAEVKMLYHLIQKDGKEKFVWTETQLRIDGDEIVNVEDKKRLSKHYGTILLKIKKMLKAKKITQYEIEEIVNNDTESEFPEIKIKVSYIKNCIVGYRTLWYGERRKKWGICEGNATALVSFDPQNSDPLKIEIIEQEESK